MIQKDIRILVVDDDESLLSMLTQLLTEEGYQVTAASSGEEALDIFCKDSFPLVVSDIKMPGMSGIELLQKVKEIEPETQVIIITSYATVETAISAIRSGVYDYMIKPFEDLELIVAVVNRAAEKIRLTTENRVLLDSLMKNKHELEQLNTVLETLAVKDGLTGVFNHRYFQEEVAKEIVRCQRYSRVFSVIFLDVDHFKHYNDKNGHPSGDDLLRKLANLLSSRLRQIDVIARYGGEEFILLLPSTTRANALICAEDIRQMIAKYPFHGREGQPMGFVSVSVGVASFPKDGTEVPALLKAADDALYQAKASGRNRVCEAAPAG